MVVTVCRGTPCCTRRFFVWKDVVSTMQQLLNLLCVDRCFRMRFMHRAYIRYQGLSPCVQSGIGWSVGDPATARSGVTNGHQLHARADRALQHTCVLCRPLPCTWAPAPLQVLLGDPLLHALDTVILSNYFSCREPRVHIRHGRMKARRSCRTDVVYSQLGLLGLPVPSAATVLALVSCPRARFPRQWNHANSMQLAHLIFCAAADANLA